MVSLEMTEKHADAIRWRSAAPCSTDVIWLPKGWATADGRDTLHPLISSGGIRRIRHLMRAGSAGLHARAYHILDERCAMQAAVRAVLSESAAFPEFVSASELFVRYSPLGQPRVGWRGRAAEWAGERGIHLSNLHISFTHDGEAVIALASYAPGLKGVGIDVVRLQRFRDKSRDYLHRFARHFMSESEYVGFSEDSATESSEQVVRRVAAHFSLMESASKALGTGLKIGGGMGKPESMSKRSLNVSRLTPVKWQLEPEPESRIQSLGASRLEGHWSADSEYLVSAAFLTK